MRGAWQRLAAGVAAVAGWRYFKPAVFLACLAPLLVIAYELGQLFLWNQAAALGADPAKALLHESGEDALALLFITLSVTPLRRIFGVNRLQGVRRMLGVWSFAYAVVHVGLYMVFEQLCYSWETCQVRAIGDDLVKRPFIIAGMVAFSAMLLLALTSTGGWVRRLRRNWQRLHRLVYVAGLAAVIHFVWIQKSDLTEPLRWAYWLAVLLGYRLYAAIRRRNQARVSAVTA